MSFGQSSTDRASMLAGLRSGAPATSSSASGYNRMQLQAEQLQLAQMQASQAQYLAKQRELWELHQTQMNLQLQAMKMQNLEIQERILAASAQQPVAQHFNRRPVSASFADINSMGLPVEQDDEFRQQRRGALNNLQRAQMHRSAESQAPATGARRYPGSRLSFNGDALAEHALARKNAASPVGSESSNRASSVTPPAVEQRNPFPRHHRKSSSLGSFASDHSATLSDSKKLLTSPSGPTLILSQPGEQFPASPPSLVNSRPLPARPLAVSIERPTAEHFKEDSNGSSSPGSESTTSSGSEVLSFESMTSVGSESAGADSSKLGKVLGEGGMVKSSSDGKLVRHALSVNKLNAAAPTFTPTRNFSTPASMMTPVVLPGAVALRQPKGPPREEEMQAKNFAGRIRKRAFKATALKLKNRSATGSAPSSPITMHDPTFRP